MRVPIIPPAIAMSVFALLVLLLVQKEVLRELGRTGTRRWQTTSNWLIGLLLVGYGGVLIARFLSLL